MTQTMPGIHPQVSMWAADPSLAAPYPHPLGRLLGDAAARWPNEEYVVFSSQPAVGEVRWTFAELDRLSSQLASGLLAEGFLPGECVGVWGPNHPEWLLLEWALFKAGMVLVTLNPLYKERELRYALEVSDVVGLFHADRVGDVALAEVVAAVRRRCPDLRATYTFTQGVPRVLDRGDRHSDAPIKAGSAATGDTASTDIGPNTLAMIQYTSGTTGDPKAVQLTHSSLATASIRSHQRWDIGPGDAVCHGFPLFHIGGSGTISLGPTTVGSKTMPLFIFSAAMTLDILESEQCTHFIGVPTMAIAMMEHPSFAGRDLSCLRTMGVGGAPLPIEVARRLEDAFGCPVLNIYGQTETCGATATAHPRDSLERKALTVGQAMDGVSLKVAAADGEPVPHGERGELCYRGPGQTVGYRKADPALGPTDASGWLHTGDMATMDANGYVRIVGRVKEMIVRGGENLSPVEIENIVSEHPAVIEVAVVGVPDEVYGEQVCACVRLREATGQTEKATPESIRAWVGEQVSRWKVPRYIVEMDELPLTASGKVRKFILREQMIEHLGLHEAAALMEGHLAQINEQ